MQQEEQKLLIPFHPRVRTIFRHDSTRMCDVCVCSNQRQTRAIQYLDSVVYFTFILSLFFFFGFLVVSICIFQHVLLSKSCSENKSIRKKRPPKWHQPSYACAFKLKIVFHVCEKKKLRLFSKQLY